MPSELALIACEKHMQQNSALVPVCCCNSFSQILIFFSNEGSKTANYVARGVIILVHDVWRRTRSTRAIPRNYSVVADGRHCFVLGEEVSSNVSVLWVLNAQIFACPKGEGLLVIHTLR